MMNLCIHCIVLLVSSAFALRLPQLPEDVVSPQLQQQLHPEINMFETRSHAKATKLGFIPGNVLLAQQTVHGCDRQPLMWSRGFSRACCNVFVQCYKGESAGTLGETKLQKQNHSAIGNYDSHFDILSQPGVSVYVPTNNLRAFLQTFVKLPSSASLVLVTGQEDQGVPREMWDENKHRSSSQHLGNYMDYNKLLADPRLKHWFTQNYDLTGCSPWEGCSSIKEDDQLVQKMTPIPIGLDLHTLDEKSHQRSAAQQVEDLYTIRSKGKKLKEKSRDVLFMPFKDGSRDGVHQIQLPNNQKIHWGGSRDKMWTQIANEYMFVCTPFGRGMDTHRIWETLNLGSIPVVRTSPLDRLYKQFPVIIVPDWSSVTDKSFQLWKNDINARFGTEPFNEAMYEKLQMKFWIGMVQEKAKPGSIDEFSRSQQCLPTDLGAPQEGLQCR